MKNEKVDSILFSYKKRISFQEKKDYILHDKPKMC